MADALSKDTETQEMLVSVLRNIDAAGLGNMKNIQFFENDISGFTGMLCEALMRFAADPDRPVIGYSRSGSIVKASARCTHAILRRGVDLSEAMRRAGESAGGGGGGHRIASGAWFPAGNEKIFLETLDTTVGEQVSAK
jgi:RecJ-like exonuclease